MLSDKAKTKTTVYNACNIHLVSTRNSDLQTALQFAYLDQYNGHHEGFTVFFTRTHKRSAESERRVSTSSLLLANSDVGKLKLYIFRYFYLHPSYIINDLSLRALLLLDITHLNRGSLYSYEITCAYVCLKIIGIWLV